MVEEKPKCCLCERTPPVPILICEGIGGPEVGVVCFDCCCAMTPSSMERPGWQVLKEWLNKKEELMKVSYVDKKELLKWFLSKEQEDYMYLAIEVIPGCRFAVLDIKDDKCRVDYMDYDEVFRIASSMKWEASIQRRIDDGYVVDDTGTWVKKDGNRS